MALRDLEEILHDVHDACVRKLVAEVVKCYESGAYRAALVSLWVAVVADLTGKIRYLAESGDGAAQKVIDDLDRALDAGNVAGVQTYERKILDTAEKQLEILLPREKEELERLNRDRNLCAHPGYLNEVELFVPDAELVRAHLVAATRCVFSQRPLAGKRLLDLLEREIKGEVWPPDGEYFLDRFFHGARESVKGNMAKILIKFSMQPPDDSNRVAERARCAALVIANEAPSLFENALRSVLRNWEDAGLLGKPQLVRCSGAYGDNQALWTAIPDTGKQRLIELLRQRDIDFLLEKQFFVSGLPRDEDECVAEEFSRIVAELDAEQFAKAVKQSANRKSFVREAICRVRNSRSFRGAEANLRVVELCSGELDHEDIECLHEAIKANGEENVCNQVRLAGDTEDILKNIFSASSSTQEARRAWRALAEWLNAEGTEKDDGFLYCDLLEACQ